MEIDFFGKNLIFSQAATQKTTSYQIIFYAVLLILGLPANLIVIAVSIRYRDEGSQTLKFWFWN